MAATILEQVKAVLAADATFGALVADENIYIPALGQASPISPTETPDAYAKASGSGVPRLRPCVVLVMTSSQPVGAGRIHKQSFLRVTVLDRQGYATTEAALNRIYALLDGGDDDGQRFVLDSGRSFTTRLVDHPVESGVDQSVVTSGATRGAAMEVARYRVDTRWPT